MSVSLPVSIRLPRAGTGAGRFLPSFIVFLVCLSGILFSLRLYFFSDVLRPNVFINNVSLKGSTRGQISEQVSILSRGIMAGKILLISPYGSWLYTPSELGIIAPGNALAEKIWRYGNGSSLWSRVRNWWRTISSPLSIPVSVEVDWEKVKTSLKQVADTVEVDPSPALVYTSEEEEGMRIIRDRTGRMLDSRKTMDRVVESFQKTPQEFQREVEVLLAEVPAQPDFKMLQEKAGLTTELIRFTTLYDTGNVPRTTNLALAAGAIDGWILAPGEVFSFNDVVGPRTAKRGFKKAPSIIGGRLVEDIGGGICQVTTTLYNCTLLTGLEILERYNHSMYFEDSAYVPQGRDAAVVWGHKDFVFRNSLNQSILVSALLADGEISIVFFGSEPIDFEITVWQEGLRILPPDTITKSDYSLPPGTSKVESEGATGYSVTVKNKTIYPDGRTTSSVVSRDIYRSRPRVVRRGTDR